MNLLTPCEPPFHIINSEMREDEARALDVLIHLIRPELIVECGTYYGGSACFFSRHARVITFDPAPRVADGAFIGMPVLQIIGAAPHDLCLIEPHIGSARWVFFHDSVHTPEFLIDELSWAFSHGAVAALWHDVALDRMLDAIPLLNERGHVAMRVMDFGKERSNWGDPPPEIWQGIGLAWNGTSSRR